MGRHPPRPVRPRSGPTSGGVLLAWARDRAGRLVSIRALDEAGRRARGPFTCPGCGEPLVARLGAVRARHFAHAPGSACPLTAPETALHLDAKQRLLALCEEAFAGRLSVVLLTRCPACRRAVPRALAELGDGAVEEGAVGALRADVLVTLGRRPALAIEVLVTHALEPAKEAALAAAGVPAVEVDAREAWEREVEGGVEVACARTLGLGPCPACLALTRAEADRALGGEAATIAELETYRARGLLGPSGRGRPQKYLGTSASSAGPAADRPRPDRESPGSSSREAPLTAAERQELIRRFSCPECGGRELSVGIRLVSHPCPRTGSRPVAWRGYDGGLAELEWWKKRGA